MNGQTESTTTPSAVSALRQVLRGRCFSRICFEMRMLTVVGEPRSWVMTPNLDFRALRFLFESELLDPHGVVKSSFLLRCMSPKLARSGRSQMSAVRSDFGGKPDLAMILLKDRV